MSEISKVRVAIVDDHQIFRNGIKALFLGNSKFQIVGEASDGLALSVLLDQIQLEILLLDISMPGKSGIEIAKEIKQGYPQIKIVMLTANDDEKSVTEAVKVGAMGFLDKNCSREELFLALEQVSNNKNYFSDNVSEVVYKQFVEKINVVMPGPLDKLSQREIEIIRLLADGLIFKEIADRLFISPRTVEAHKNNILEKLRLKTNADLIKFAIRHNLTSL
jgi:DNA-binding NarL/FixJ family response regulator